MGALSPYYDEYVEFAKTRLKNNAHIYDWASEGQIKVLRGYMRTRSRAIYGRLNKNRNWVLKVAPDKAIKLAEISGDAQDWEYTGCVDLGYLGAGHCSLGHALRYAHYATSIDTGSELVFGSTCASDFFSIPPEVLNRIKSLQGELVDEFKPLAFIVETGRLDAWIKDNYGDFEQLVNTYGADVARKAFGTYIEPMVQFWQAGIPWTSYMIGVYNNAKYKTYVKLDVENRRLAKAKELAGGDDDTAAKLGILEKHRSLHYVNTVITMYGSDELTEDQKQEALSHACDLCTVYDQVADNMRSVKNLRMSFNYQGKWLVELAQKAHEDVWVVKTKEYQYPGKDDKAKDKSSRLRLGDKGLRLATVGEVNCLHNKMFVADNYPVGRGEFQACCLLAWAISGNQYVYDLIGVYKAKETDEAEKVLESSKNMSNSLNWALRGKYQETLDKLIEYTGVKYLETAEDELPLGKRLVVRDIFEYLHENAGALEGCKKRSLADDIKVANSIREQCERWSKEPSLRQTGRLRYIYDEAREYLGDSMYDKQSTQKTETGKTDGSSGEDEYSDDYFGDYDSGVNPLVAEAMAHDAELTKPKDIEISGQDLIYMAEAVNQYKYMLNKNTWKFQLSVCETVGKYGRCSDKQKKFVLEVYNALYKLLKSKNQIEGLVESQEERQLKAKKAQETANEPWGYSGDGANIVDIDDGDKAGADGESGAAPVDLEALRKKKGIPTVLEISVALGSGLFTEGTVIKQQ